MAIPSRQIGWGTEENLLWQISKQLESLTRVVYNIGGNTNTTTTTTTTVAPTTTTTTTAVVYKTFTFYPTLVGSSSAACAFTTYPTTWYFTGPGTYPTIGDSIYGQPSPPAYQINGWFKLSNGHAIYGNDSTIIIDDVDCSATTTTSTTAAPTYTIGQAALGGVIAYINGGGTSGTSGLVATVADISSGAEWGCNNTLITGADGTAIGTGNQNTIDILAECGTPGIAARLCGDLIEGGYSDWYLPSKDELNALYINQVAVGGFTSSLYWSSTEFANYAAWAQDFTDGQQFDFAKIAPHRVRAIRSF